MQGIVE